MSPAPTPSRPSLPDTVRSLPATDQGGESLAPIREAFELFDQQSRRLQEAYQSLKRDLARSNETLQERNRELIAKIQELRQVSSRLESVIEGMTDGLLVIGPDRRIERCNSSTEHMLNQSRARMEKAEFSSVVGLEEAHTALEQVLHGGPPTLDRSWIVHHDGGESSHLLLSLAPVKAPDGHVLGAVCNLRDVTEIRRLEKKLHSQERLAALGEMAASVAHEIRNPLGTIEGFARLLRRDLAGMPEHLRLAERIVEGAQNLNYVISNLLTYARPMRLHMTSVPIAHLWAACRDTLCDRGSRAGVDIDLPDLPPDIVVNGDQRQLAQMLLNLGINAIEACRSGSGRMRIEAHGGKHSVMVRVCDNGCGMDADQIEKVFDPFFTSKEGGTGLGLSLTRKIVDAHGGDIAVESEPHKGSVFTVTLPREGVAE